MDAMDGMTLEHLMMDILTTSAHHNSLTQQEGDFGAFKYKVKVLLDNLLVKFDQDVHYQRDLEEQIDNLEVENMGKDKCIKRLSRDAKEAIYECRSEADEMADKMMTTVKLLQRDNALYQVNSFTFFCSNSLKFI